MSTNKSNSNASTKKADMKVNKSTEKKPSVEDIQKVLDEQIKKFNHKAMLIKHRETFKDTREQLIKFKKDQGSDYDDNLDSKILRIALQDNREYSRNETYLSVANNMIVREFLDFAIEKIEKKLIELEKEIIG